VPDELLQHLIGPTPYPQGWWWLAIGLSAIMVLWYAAVLIMTMPGRRSGPAVITTMRHEWHKRRFARAVHTIGQRYRTGELGAAAAGAELSHQLRKFLHTATGIDTRYMQNDELRHSELASAASIFDELTDVRFNTRTDVDITAVSASAEELIRTWN